MKMNQTHPKGHSKGLALAAAGLLGLMVITGMSFAVRVCAEKQREVVDAENDEVVTSRIEHIARINYFVRQISNGKADEVKRIMSLELAGDVAAARASMAPATAGTRLFAESFCNLILKDEKTHPEHYLTAVPEARLTEQKAWEMIGVEEVKPISQGGHSSLMGLAENN